MKAVSSEKTSCMKQTMEPNVKNNINSLRIPCPSPGPGLYRSSCPNPKHIENSKRTAEKVAYSKKKSDPATKNSKHLRNNSCPNLELFPSSSPSLSWETASTSSSVATCMRSNDSKISDSGTNPSQNSRNSTQSDSLDSSAAASIKRHTGGNLLWEAIQLTNSRDPPLGLSHFRLLKRLGYGDIGSVYLVELTGTNTFFAMKVMDRASLVSRNKLLRAHTEREILTLLDHPFLPTLYSHYETDKYYCLVMEYCNGGTLHSLRQKQPNKYFSEQAARFYTSEVLLALEYLHMLGIVYRDLKPENVLVREDGHIMLSDFDLSLQCSVNPTLVKSSSVSNVTGMIDKEHVVQGCIQPTFFFPRILSRKKHSKSKSDFSLSSGALLELLAEPTNARSMSFVGTHEYLAPEIIRGEGHGSAVDWWTLGIFLYELMYGKTPFKGSGNQATHFNVVEQSLRFPEVPAVSSAAQELIRSLLVKDPHRRIAYRRGATEIKQHPFFEGLNWALVRCTTPPYIPEQVDFGQFAKKEAANKQKKTIENCGGNSNSNVNSHPSFDYF